MSKTIWLSGSRGFVGAYVKQQLIDAGVTVKCLSNSASRDDDVICVDFSSKTAIKAAVEQHGVPETFIHLGWGRVYEPHHEDHIGKNLEDGKNLIDQLYECGVKRILSIGSSSEYGDRTGALCEDQGATGELNNYVDGKTALAQYGLAAAEKLVRIFIHVRLYYTYGAGQQHNSLINQLFKNGVEGNVMELSPCLHFRDYIYVVEAADGIIRMAATDESGIINLGSGTVIQLKEFVKTFWHMMGCDEVLLTFGSHTVPRTEQSQPRSYADLTRLKAQTSWVPSLPVIDGIKQTVERLHLHNHG